MAPRADEYDQDELSSSEDDDGFKEDMESLRQACRIAEINPDNFKPTSTVTPDDENADAVLPKAPDPLLGPGDALVPVSDSDDEQSDLQYLQRVQELYQTSSLKPLKVLPALSLSDDDEDDTELLRVIMNRFGSYEKGHDEDNVDKMAEGAHSSGLCSEVEFDNSVASKGLDPGEACKSSKLLEKRPKFPFSAQVFIDAIKKNRSFQRLLRSKLIQMETKIQENRQLMERVKLLRDFQVSCMRRTGKAISLKKDPRVLLISTRKSPASSNTKINDKKVSPMCYGPAENAHVAKYKMVLERSSFSLDRKKWSNVERENLAKGIKQQFQEKVLQMSINQDSSEWSRGHVKNFDTILASIKDLEITPENIRMFLPEFNWDQLASKYVVGRTGAECEARWLNCEDPLINHSTWTCEEDKLLLHIVQEIGNRNWFKIAESLSTNRTPFQCLARYQRSLNPSVLNSEWTEDEDDQLRRAVAHFGVSNWQSVASILERRTGTQCSNRWKKSLCPDKKGSFTVEENERLTVAVRLFGRKWNQIAKFIPGRTQSQCRDRYVNSLDPSLKWGGWTEEEDSRLKEAIAKHGFCWSKVAADVPPRTDSQCRKRWRVLFPDQVPMLQAARKMQKSALSSNFVDRESERPCLSLNDFLPLAILDQPSDPDAVNLPQKRKLKSQSSNTSKNKRPQKRRKKAQSCLKNRRPLKGTIMSQSCLRKVQADKVEPFSGHGIHKPKITEPHLEDNSVEAAHDHSPLDLVVATTNGQEDLGGNNNIEKLIGSNQMRNGFNELHEESHTCITSCENPKAGRPGGHCEKISSMDSLKHQTGRKSTLCASISDGAAVGSKVARNTTSVKERKEKGKFDRMVRSVQTAEDHMVKNKMPKPVSLSSMPILESQDEDNVILARDLCNLSNKRFKNTNKMTQAASSMKKTRRSLQASKQTHDCLSSSLKKGCELLSEEVHNGHDRNQEMLVMQDKNLDKDCIDVTPGALLVQNHFCNLKNMSTAKADDNGKAVSGPVDEQAKFLDGATEPKNIIVGKDEATDVTLASLLKKKKRKGKAMAEPVDEQAMVSNGLTETKGMSVGDDGSLDVTLASLLKKKGRRQGRAAKCGKRPSLDVTK
ncbi:hypothetical protein QN277_012305 [Acacia crassicarpa]|uniref:Uncharacterized protein n=1 Tax=Acacia crassicarpa TaxID=499986 RepID=A0AAE1N0X0_9FABA|nr:hypothetical protein QN277_012305 [Acacia crassicarpa]